MTKNFLIMVLTPNKFYRYESTGPEFHYEAHKNREMLRHDQHWEDMLKYRDSLQRSSLELRKSYQAIL